MKKIFLLLLALICAVFSSCSSAATTQSTTTYPNTSTTPTQTATITSTTTHSTTAVITTTTTTLTTPVQTTAATSTVFPSVFYVPNAAPYQPTGAELDLFQYTLGLINTDRQSAGLPPVTLTFNAAAEKHAQDMFSNYYGGHWGPDGFKPYMRYTFAGGLDKEGENSAYSGWTNPADDPSHYESINVREEIAALEHIMMYDDAMANWGHRDTIINKYYTTVNLGIVYDGKRLALVEQFNGRFADFYSAPAISGGNLTLLGKLTYANIQINNISIAYDTPPQTLTNAQLTTDPTYTDGYSLGDRLVTVIPPAPAGQQYSNLPPTAIIADKWEINSTGQFSVQANISSALSKGPGVYTIVIVALINGESVNLTNYSIIIK